MEEMEEMEEKVRYQVQVQIGIRWIPYGAGTSAESAIQNWNEHFKKRASKSAAGVRLVKVVEKTEIIDVPEGMAL